jgi:MFS family permease
MGVLGNAGINAPLYVYIARWFDRRRGTALALIASGQAVAGTIWAPLFGHAIQAFGWRYTMHLYALFAIVAIVLSAFLIFGAASEPVSGGAIEGAEYPPLSTAVHQHLPYICRTRMLKPRRIRISY